MYITTEGGAFTHSRYYISFVVVKAVDVELANNQVSTGEYNKFGSELQALVYLRISTRSM